MVVRFLRLTTAGKQNAKQVLRSRPIDVSLDLFKVVSREGLLRALEFDDDKFSAQFDAENVEAGAQDRLRLRRPQPDVQLPAPVRLRIAPV